MRQSLVLDDSDATPGGGSGARYASGRFDQPVILRNELGGFVARACLVCGAALTARNGKVHPGACARARKTALQQRRRQRGGR